MNKALKRCTEAVNTKTLSKTNKRLCINYDVLDSKIYLPVVIQRKIFSYIRLCEVCNVVIDPDKSKNINCFLDICSKCSDLYTVIVPIDITKEKRISALDWYFSSHN